VPTGSIFDVKDRAVALIKEFQERGLIDDTWKFKWDYTRRRLGQCDHTKHTIGLSLYHAQVSDDASIENTIRHEIAHAIAGHAAGHGPDWKRACRVTGAIPVRCTPIESVGDIPSRYVGVCPLCKFEYKANRRLKQMHARFCVRKGCDARLKKVCVKWFRNVPV
jgi:SprT protein